MKSFALKLLAFFFAVIFWFFVLVINQNIKSLPFSLPVQVFNIPENLSLTEDTPVVSLRIDAPQEVMNTLSENDFSSFVDLTGLDVGTHMVDIEVSSKNPKVRIVDVSPKKTSLTLEILSEKEIPITIKTEGDPSPGYIKEEPISQNKIVTIKGAESVVQKATSAQVIVKLRGDEISEIRTRVYPSVLNESGAVITELSFDPELIDVVLPLREVQKSKVIGVQADFTGTLQEINKYISHIEITPSVVTLVGEDSDIRKTSTIQTEPIDLLTIKDSAIFRKRLQIPKSLQIKESPFVTVRLVLEEYEF